MTNANVTENQYKVTVSEGVTTVVTAKAPGPQGADAVLQAGDRGDFTVSVANNGAQTAVINSGAINNSKVASDASIDGSKINPNFGSQNISTTGTLGTGDITISKAFNPSITFNDGNNENDFEVSNAGGLFRIRDIDAGFNRFTISSASGGNGGVTSINNHLDVGNGLDVTGIITGTSHLDLPSDAKLKLGDNDLFEIFHQSSNGNAIIKEQGGGGLSIQSNGAFINFYDIENNRFMANFNTGSSCQFRHGANIRLATSSTGIDVTGDISVSGTVDSVDLSTYEANGASYLRSDADDSFTGTLTANSDGVNPIIKVQGNGPNFIRFASSAGGTVDSDSIDLVYRATPNTLGFERANDSQTMFSVDADTQQATFNGNVDCNAGLDVTSGNLTVATGDLDVTEGDLTVSGDALYVDYAGGRVGMGTLSPQANLHIKSQGDCILVLQGDSNNQQGYDHSNPFIKFLQDGSEQKSVVGMNPYNATDESDSLVLANSTIGSNGGIVFKTGTAAPYTNAVTRMKIESNGSVFLHNGLTVKDASGSDPTLFLQHSEPDVLGEVLRIGRTDSPTISYHSVKAQSSNTTSDNLISFHLHDASGQPHTGQQEVLKLQGNKQVTVAGNLDVGEGLDVNGEIITTVGAANATFLSLVANMGNNNDRKLTFSAPDNDSGIQPFTIYTNNSVEFEVDNARTLFIDDDGAVNLHHDGSTTAKLSTSAEGVDVNGTVNITREGGGIAGLKILDSGHSSGAPYIEVIGRRDNQNGSPCFSGKVHLARYRDAVKVVNGNVLGAVAFGGNHTQGGLSNILYTASISGVASGDFDANDDMPTDLVFYTGSTGRTTSAANVTTGDERMRITATGNLAVNTDTLFVDSTNDKVGINKATPDSALDVSGQIRSFSTTGTSDSGLKVSSANESAHLYLKNGNSNADFNISYGGSGGPDITITHDGTVKLFNGGASTAKLATSASGISVQGTVEATANFRNDVPTDFWNTGTHVAVGDLGHIGTHGAFEFTITSGGYRRQVDGAGKWKDITIDGQSGFGCQVALAPKTGKIHFRSNSGLSTDDNNPSGAGLADKMVVSTTGVDITGKATMTESAAIADTNLRKITTSTSAPTSSDGGVGDIWIVYPS